ncbi:hypothetical protein [Yersinia intermedia]|uniref:hypothetical protein n=1 Tax=Yersinia intermedia TaxID=631 RepID=UPI003BB20DEF
MCIELREQGFNVGRYLVRQIMKTLLLVAKRPGRHRYPCGGKPAVVAANLLNRQFIEYLVVRGYYLSAYLSGLVISGYHLQTRACSHDW